MSAVATAVEATPRRQRPKLPLTAGRYVTDGARLLMVEIVGEKVYVLSDCRAPTDAPVVVEVKPSELLSWWEVDPGG